MGKSLAWALLVLLIAAGGGVASAVYFAVIMGAFDAAFGAGAMPDGSIPGLGQKAGIAAFSFGVPAGALFAGLLIDEGFRKDDSWALMIPSFIVIAALLIFCLYFYFSQDAFGLVTIYKAPGYLAVLGLFAFVGWFGKKVMGART
jgi:hypothetical protein